MTETYPTWAPYITYQESISVLRDQELQDTIATTKKAAHAILENHAARGCGDPSIDMWAGHGMALCSYAIYALAEARSRSLEGGETLNQIDTSMYWFVAVQYLMRARGELITSPPWYEEEHVRRTHQASLKAISVEYSTRFPTVSSSSSITWPGVARENDPPERPRISSETNLCTCTRPRQVLRNSTEIGDWWTCSLCGNPPVNWLRAAARYLPDHKFTGGCLDNEVKSTGDILKNPEILDGYTFSCKVAESMFFGDHMFIWHHSR